MSRLGRMLSSSLSLQLVVIPAICGKVTQVLDLGADRRAKRGAFSCVKSTRGLKEAEQISEDLLARINVRDFTNARGDLRS